MGLCLIQINLAEAEYNLGQLQQRAWIAAHEGNAEQALQLTSATKPSTERPVSPSADRGRPRRLVGCGIILPENF